MANENVLMYTMGYYSNVKKNEIMKFAFIQTDLKKIILTEVTQKDQWHMFLLICVSWIQVFSCEYTTWSNCRNQGSKRDHVGSHRENGGYW